MKTATKNEIRNYCAIKNFSQPRFSGKNKTMYVTSNISYTIDQMLSEMVQSMGYKIKRQMLA